MIGFGGAAVIRFVISVELFLGTAAGSVSRCGHDKKTLLSGKKHHVPASDQFESPIICLYPSPIPYTTLQHQEYLPPQPPLPLHRRQPLLLQLDITLAMSV